MIGTNKKDANETAQHCSRTPPPASCPRGEGDLEEVLVDRGLPFVEYAGWEAIDEHERSLGRAAREAAGQAVTWDELLGRARNTVV